MISVFIFAGTTEGRELASRLARAGCACTVSVATEYGAIVIPPHENISVLQGRLSHTEMEAVFANGDWRYIIDATHPFAVQASKEIKTACAHASLPYVRLARDTRASEAGDARFFDDIDSAAQWLESQRGAILVTTGSKELFRLTKHISDVQRLFVRVLPSVESIKLCNEAGIYQKHIIAMQGPFSQEQNELHIKECKAAFVLTKESGVTGGYFEKVLAAQNQGAQVVVLRNPESRAPIKDSQHAFSVNDVLLKICKETGISLAAEQKTLTLIGSGVGSEEELTQQAKQALSEADIIFGASRILRTLPKQARKTTQELYRADDILSYLDAHPVYERPVVVFSGDSGFFSGAHAFTQRTYEQWNIVCYPGIASPVYFAAKLKKSWQNWHFASTHGSACNVIGTILTHKSTFFILSGVEDVQHIGEKLLHALNEGVLSEITCFVGFQLSYPDEEITHTTSDALAHMTKPGLYVLLIENAQAHNPPRALNDEDFIRSEHIPMTKKDVRTLSLSALSLSEDAVVYDIGSGTGSLTVEIARHCTNGTVYAIDANEHALALTQKNCAHFALENVVFVQGRAPEVITTNALPPPTHVFIGGSNGALAETCKTVLSFNPMARIVAHFVTLESLAAFHALITTLSVRDVEIKLVSITKSEQAGQFHLLKAQNPVYIASFTGSAHSEETPL